MAFCGSIELHEGSHVLGRELFGTHKVPHVSRRHLKLDVRLGEIEVIVVSNLRSSLSCHVGFKRLKPMLAEAKNRMQCEGLLAEVLCQKQKELAFQAFRISLIQPSDSFIEMDCCFQVGQNPAAITNAGFPTIRLRPGESALLRDRGTLEFLPGRLQFEVVLKGEKLASPTARKSDEIRVGVPEILKKQVASEDEGRGQEGTCRIVQSGEPLALRENQLTPPLTGQSIAPRVQTDTQLPLSSKSEPLVDNDGHAPGSTMPQAEHPSLGKGGRVQLDTQDVDCHPGEHPSSHQDQLAQDEHLARRLQEEEGAHGGAHSHHSKEQLASDEALARMLQEQEGAGGHEQDAKEPDRKRQQRSETDGETGDASTSGRSPEECGCHGSDGPGAFQLLQVVSSAARTDKRCGWAGPPPLGRDRKRAAIPS